MARTQHPIVERFLMNSQITPIANRMSAMPMVIINGVAESDWVNGLCFAQYSVVDESNIATPDAIISRFHSSQIAPISIMPRTGASNSPHNLAIV